MGSRWICIIDGVESGPHSFQELAALVRTRRLSTDAPVRSQESNQWVPAEDVIGLMRAVRMQQSASETASEESARTAGALWDDVVSAASTATPDAARSGRHDRRVHSHSASSARVLLFATATCLLGLALGISSAWRMINVDVPRFQHAPPPTPIHFFGFGPLSQLEYFFCWADVALVALVLVWLGITRFTPRRLQSVR